MFRKINRSDAGPQPVSLTVEGKTITASSEDTVAAALLAAGYEYIRTTPVSGAKRAPFCLMGICFDCLVEIDGIPNQKACQTYVREGMRINLQQKAGKLVP